MVKIMIDDGFTKVEITRENVENIYEYANLFYDVLLALTFHPESINRVIACQRNEYKISDD